jgi:hypothetical protein
MKQKTRSGNIKHNSTVTYFCKTSIAEDGSEISAHRIVLYTPISNFGRNRDCLSTSRVCMATRSSSASTCVRASRSASWAVDYVTCLLSACIYTLTFQAYTFSHAFDKYAANRSDKDRRCLDMPGMARVEKLGSPPDGSKQKVRPYG